MALLLSGPPKEVCRRVTVAVSNKKYDSTVFEPVLLMDWAGFELASSAHQQLFSRLSLFITYLKGAEL
jgi:hypothetical protein